MARSPFRLSRRAASDLQEIAEYLGAKNPSAAQRVLETLLDTIERISENPEMGARRDDLHPGIRMFVPRSPADS